MGKAKKSIHGIFICIVIMCIAIFICKIRTYTFSEITQSYDQKIYSVNVDEQKENVDYVLKKYKNAKFKKYSGKWGNTRRSKMEFYDKNGKLLFEMTDCGNSLNVVSISINGKDRTYQYSKE